MNPNSTPNGVNTATGTISIDTNIPSIDNNKILNENPAIRELLNKFKEKAQVKQDEKKSSKSETSIVRNPTSKKRTSAYLKSLLADKLRELQIKEVEIKTNQEKADEWIKNSVPAFEEVENEYTQKEIELLKTQTQTKSGKELLIAYYKEMINQYENDLKEGNYDESFSQEFTEDFAKLMMKKEAKINKVKKNYIDEAQYIINTVLGGINLDGKTSNRKGMIQEKELLMKEIENLQMDLSEATKRESMTVKDKDMYMGISDMVNKLTEDSDKLDNYVSDSDLVSASSDLDDMKSDS